MKSMGDEQSSEPSKFHTMKMVKCRENGPQKLTAGVNKYGQSPITSYNDSSGLRCEPSMSETVCVAVDNRAKAAHAQTSL